MKDAVARVLPVVFGVLVGWILFHPPSWLAGLGAWAYLVTLAVAALAFVAFVGLSILRNLPAHLVLRDLPPEAVPPDLRRLADEVVALGFFGAGPALEVGVSPTAVMVPLVAPAEPTYAAAYRTRTVPSVTALDFVSILDGGRGGLTSCSDPRGATLLGGPGELRQILPGATPAELLAAHREAVALLRSRGLGCRAVTPGTFGADLTAAIAAQRRAFLATPLHATLVAIWRSVSGRTPHLGPLGRQAIAERQIAWLVTGLAR